MIGIECHYEGGYFIINIQCSPRQEVVLERVLEDLYNICECMNIHCSCTSAAICECIPYWFRINE